MVRKDAETESVQRSRILALNAASDPLFRPSAVSGDNRIHKEVGKMKKAIHRLRSAAVTAMMGMNITVRCDVGLYVGHFE